MATTQDRSPQRDSQPRKPAGRHRRAASRGVAGQLRSLAAASRPAVATRHRAAAQPPLPKAGGALGTALATLDEVERLTWLPVRLGSAEARFPSALPDVQFDTAAFIPPAQTIDGLEVHCHPVHTVFLTARLLRTPGREDQQALAGALDAIDANYPFRPEGVFTTVAYGLPYFRRLPGGLSGPLVFQHLPRLRSDVNRFVLADPEVAAGPDGEAADDDLLITLRSDRPGNIRDVINWLRGSNLLAGRPITSPRLAHLLTFTSSRAMFVQVGLPRKIATAHDLRYAAMLDFRSFAWDGSTDGAADAAAGTIAAAEAVTFAGYGPTPTTAAVGDYFDRGAIQPLTHAVLDLDAYYDHGRPRALEAGPSARAHPGNGRWPAEPAATSGVPLEGPGFDPLDVPDGSNAPKLHASGFFPTAHDTGSAAADRLRALARVTRRQNFLAPPRRHRAFPLLELR